MGNFFKAKPREVKEAPSEAAPLEDIVEHEAGPSSATCVALVRQEGEDQLAFFRRCGREGGVRGQALVSVDGPRVRNEAFGLYHKVQFLDWFEKASGSQAARLQDASMKYGVQPKVLRKLLQDKHGLRKALQERGYTASGQLTRQQAQLPQYLRSSTRRTKAWRRKGAGKPSGIAFLFPAVKAWFVFKRQMGCHVTRSDLVRIFKLACERFLRGMDDQRATRKLEVRGEMRMEAVAVRLARLQDGRHMASRTETLWRQILRYCDGRLLTPQRVVPMSREEERSRAIETWRGWDHALWQAAFGGQEWLKDRVLDPVGFALQRQSCVLAFSDQIPFWI